MMRTVESKSSISLENSLEAKGYAMEGEKQGRREECLSSKLQELDMDMEASHSVYIYAIGFDG